MHLPHTEKSHEALYQLVNAGYRVDIRQTGTSFELTASKEGITKFYNGTIEEVCVRALEAIQVTLQKSA